MFNMRELKSTIENSDFYDSKFELKNLDYEDLLNKAVGQTIHIKKLEKAHIEYILEIDNLKEQNERMQESLLSLNREN